MTMIEHLDVATNGIHLHVATMGQGPAVLLLHGWPHTGALWAEVMPLLADAGFRAIAPDLRGLGGSTRVAGGYDLYTQAADMAGLLAALEIQQAMVAGIDLGVGVAWMLAMRHRTLIRGLALSEGMIGDLPGAERFLARGAPWWFGFHSVPGLAEAVIEGHEGAYLDWFYKDVPAMPPEIRDAFVAAYSGREALRCGFEHYRSFAENGRQIREALADRPTVEQATLAIVGGVVGDAIHGQLASIARDLRRVDIADCHHIVPLEQPRAFADALIEFDRRSGDRG
ncbi:alpha/beta fold hydrolase [Sphingomonas bacterium]|uniref:alpha/beta fold hydrolase n=1 Tax=Sphingomonas bacterium TaxID=1895847 RepID=UPI001C2D26D0|nr:alpha/beta fold hydrolase [Sphingomonas bacterium]